MILAAAANTVTVRFGLGAKQRFDMIKLSSLAVMVFAGFLLAACDGGSSPESSADSSAATEQTDTTVTGSTEAPKDETKPTATD